MTDAPTNIPAPRGLLTPTEAWAFGVVCGVLFCGGVAVLAWQAWGRP